jgi:hypothetical protein
MFRFLLRNLEITTPMKIGDQKCFKIREMGITVFLCSFPIKDMRWQVSGIEIFGWCLEVRSYKLLQVQTLKPNNFYDLVIAPNKEQRKFTLCSYFSDFKCNPAMAGRDRVFSVGDLS